MTTSKRLASAAVVAFASLAIHGPASAQQAQSVDRSDPMVEQRERDTNQALLAALLNRRAALIDAPGSAESKREALSFLDGRIEQVRRRLER